MALNTIVAESLDYIATELEKATGGDPAKLNAAVQKLLQDIITKHGAVIFNGDSYSEAWHEEAEKRGLPNLKTSVDALPVIAAPEVVAAVREVRRAHAARSCKAATTSTSSSTARRSAPRPS